MCTATVITVGKCTEEWQKSIQKYKKQKKNIGISINRSELVEDDEREL